MIFLTDQEKKKFATYLRQNARGDQALVKQLEKLGSSHQVMAQRMSIRATAMILVAEYLDEEDESQ